MSVAKNSFVLTFEKPSFKSAVSYCAKFGTDGVAYLYKAADGYGYTLYNLDGSRAAFCGNASLCVARYLFDSGLQKGEAFSIFTDSGKRCVAVEKCGKNTRVTLALPLPNEYAVCGYNKECGRLAVEKCENKVEYSARLIDTGNRHVVIFGVESDEDEKVRLSLEKSGLFPSGVNVEFAAECEKGLQVRVYERGCGRTAACGSGAAAVAFAARLEGIIRDSTAVFFDGGEIDVEILQSEMRLTAFPIYEKRGKNNEN